MFYEYNQNNSGGSFDFDAIAGISHFVIVEANSPKQADALAEGIGLYFNGVDEGRDCDCCGDRWHPQWRDDGMDAPRIYGFEVGADKPYHSTWLWMKDQPEAFIHYLDGRIVPVEGVKITYEEEKARFAELEATKA